MAFSEGVTSGSLTRLAVDGGEEEKKPAGVSWDAELHRAYSAPAPKVL